MVAKYLTDTRFMQLLAHLDVEEINDSTASATANTMNDISVFFQQSVTEPMNMSEVSSKRKKPDVPRSLANVNTKPAKPQCKLRSPVPFLYILFANDPMADVVLSECISSQILDTLKQLENQLDQLRHEQNALGQSIADASGHIASDLDELVRMKETMAKVSAYYTKLLSLRSTMTMLSTRAGQLHRRADKLKQIKLQYLSQIDTIRRTEQERDQIIAARVITPSPSKAVIVTPLSPTSTRSSPRQIPTAPTPAGEMDTMPTSDPDAPSTGTTISTVSDTQIMTVPKKVKKKKAKAREVAISDESWTPKRTSSRGGYLSSNCRH
ncbi:hypothetical protein BX666DRAFT_821741 [Dichotomocladium elegans]|nr:hypothetical protein BX666DRAFT_821741 [Dichotomocladium elegans]